MLVYTNLFTVSTKEPKNNKYIAMFYIWFTYIKKYGGLTSNDTVGIIIDDLTFSYINDLQFFAYISNDVPFNIEVSTYPPPSNLLEGVKERYNYSHCKEFTKNTLNLYLDIDCLTIRKISSLFSEEYTNSIFVAPEGKMIEGNYGGFFVSDEPDAADLPGFSSGCFAWTHSDAIQIFFDNVIKGITAEADTPLYTLDQPFYNYQLYLCINTKLRPELKGPELKGPDLMIPDLKIYIMESKIISINPLFSDEELSDAFFVNFCGEPGIEDCHFNKILAFMCVDFSFTRQQLHEASATHHQQPLLPAEVAQQKEEHGLPQ